MAPNEFLSPFLEVIRSEDTTGPITGLALTSINKFLSYGLIEATCETAAPAIENIADAVTHARFVGTDPGSDEVVLMKILHVSFSLRQYVLFHVSRKGKVVLLGMLISFDLRCICMIIRPSDSRCARAHGA